MSRPGLAATTRGESMRYRSFKYMYLCAVVQLTSKIDKMYSNTTARTVYNFYSECTKKEESLELPKRVLAPPVTRKAPPLAITIV